MISLSYRKRRPARRGARFVLAVMGVLTSVVVCSCSSKAPAGAGHPSGPAGGPKAGPPDTHCTSADGGQVTVVPRQAACHPDAGATGGGDAGADDAGAASDYGPTRYGTEADDDDCKYHVSYSVTPVYENYDATFTVTATYTNDGKPLTGAHPYAEVFLNDKHPAPPTSQNQNETQPGVYKIGPIRFDAAGTWTVRFHFYQDCVDLLEESPHGHVAFFVDVP